MTLEQYRSFFRDIFSITEAEILQQLCSVAKTECCKKDVRLIDAGERQKSLYFLISGVLRGYTVDENGRDITDCLAFRYGEVIIGNYSEDGISQISVEALSECTLISVPVGEMDRLLAQYPALLKVYSRYLHTALVQHWEIKRLLYQPAMQRYLWFLDSYPGLINTVCNKHIASFLGITPVTLSRLRRQLREEVGAWPP